MLRLSALIAVLAAVATPALAQNSIRPGQTVRGELTASDPTLDDGSHYDCFAVQTRRGQSLQIDQMSDAFDSYLTVGAGSCATPDNPASDDDGGGGVNARVVRVGDGGMLTIRVNSLEGGKTGAYQLRVTEVAGGATAPANGAGATSIGVGQTVRGELSGSDPALSDGSHFDCFQVQTRRGQSLQIDQISNAFDSFMSIGSGSCAALTNATGDDDGGDGLNSRLVFEGDGSLLTILVNSIERGETGGYQLTVSEAGREMTGDNAFEGVDLTTIGAARTTTLPRVTSEWDVELPTCAAAYGAWLEMFIEGAAPREYGNTASIDYPRRYEAVHAQLRTDEDRAIVGIYKMNFKSMALVGAIGVAPNGQPNGGRPLAEYLTALGNCDREHGFSPVTTY